MTKHNDALPALSNDEIVDAFCKMPHPHQFVSAFHAGARFAEQRVLAALAAREGQPVAWQHKTHADGKWLTTDMDPEAAREWNTVAESRPLYAAPPAPSQAEASVQMGPLCTAHGPVRYQRVTPTQAQRNAAGASPLFQIGDMVLAWVNEGDLYAAPPAPSHEAMRAALEALEGSRDDVNEVLSGYLHGEGYASYDRRIKQYREQLARHDAAIALLRAALGRGE